MADGHTSQASPAAATVPAPTGRPTGRVQGRLLVLVMLAGTALTVLLSLAVAAIWMSDLLHERETTAAKARAAIVAQTLGMSAAELIRADELTSLRRLLPELAREHDLLEIALTTPDGQVVAHSEPARISLVRLPDRWQAGAVDDATLGDPAAAVRAVALPGRGPLLLTVRPRLPTGKPDAAVLTGAGTVAALAILGLLVLYRRVARPVNALGLIGTALAEARQCHGDWSLLRIDERHGPEAAAWNELIDRLSERASAPAPADDLPGRLPPDHDPTDLEQAINILPTGVVILDRSASICRINNMGAMLLGGQTGAMLGKSLATLLPDAEIQSINAALAQGQVPRKTFEIKRSTPAGESVLRVNCRPLRRDDGAAALVLLDDVTQQRIADASRNLFIAQATHELRTPLTNMRLALEELVGDDAPPLPDPAPAHINMLQTEVRRLERIVSDMLAVAEIEAGSMKLTRGEIKLDRLIAELQQDLAPAAAKKNIGFTVHLPPKLPQLIGDREKLTQALHNLLGNALKYTPDGGRVSLTVDETDDHMVRFIVADTGMGISREDQGRLFNRFARGSDPRLAGITGTGLGLALSREIARLHGGDITLESELDKGSVFTLLLPGGRAADRKAA